MVEEYMLAYIHHNGAEVFERADGKKHIRFDDLVFDKMSDVNEYIEKHRVRLTKEKNAREQKQVRIEKSKESHNQLTNEDWNMLKGE